MNHLLECIDLFALVLIHLANYYKIRKNSFGWALSAVAICYFMTRAYHMGLVAQTLGHIVSLTTALYGFYQWRK